MTKRQIRELILEIMNYALLEAEGVGGLNDGFLDIIETQRKNEDKKTFTELLDQLSKRSKEE